MPYETILNVALTLAGAGEREAGQKRWDPPPDHPAIEIFSALIMGARLGKLAATRETEWHITEWLAISWSAKDFCGRSVVDLDEARAFIRSRGIISPDSAGSPKIEGRRDEQLRRMQEKAAKPTR